MTTTQALDVQGALDDALSSVASFVPKFVGFLVILVIGWILASLLRKATALVLRKIGFERAVERGGLDKPLANSKYDASDLVAKVVYYGVLLVAFTMAFGVFGPNPISDLLSSLVAFLPRVIVAIVIVVIAAAIARAVRDLVTNLLGTLSYGKLLANLASIFIMALGAIAALNQVGVATTVTTPVLIAVLATIGGILVVGVGGGAVRPMQARWERWLDVAERETRNLSHTVHHNGHTEPAATDQQTEQFPAHR
jgi:small-conductance mechanosensitive channel